MPSLEPENASASRSLKRLLENAARTAIGPVIAFVGVKSYAVDVPPIFDRDPDKKLIRRQFESIVPDVMV